MSKRVVVTCRLTVRLLRPQRQYVGLGTWNSRGVTLEDAVRAMLGDGDVAVESPALLTRRLQLRLGRGSAAYQAALDERLYDSEPRRNWGGLNSFRRSWVHAAAQRPNKAPLTGHRHAELGASRTVCCQPRLRPRPASAPAIIDKCSGFQRFTILNKGILNKGGRFSMWVL